MTVPTHQGSDRPSWCTRTKTFGIFIWEGKECDGDEEMTLRSLTRYKCDHKSLIAVVYKEGGGGRAYQIKSPSFVINGGNYQQNRISPWTIISWTGYLLEQLSAEQDKVWLWQMNGVPLCWKQMSTSALIYLHFVSRVQYKSTLALNSFTESHICFYPLPSLNKGMKGR